MLGWLVRFIIRKLREHLAELQREIDAYEAQRKVAEAKQAQLQQDISTATAANADLEKQLQQQHAANDALKEQLQTQIAAADETERQLKDALTPKPKPALSDDAELERLSSRTS